MKLQTLSNEAFERACELFDQLVEMSDSERSVFLQQSTEDPGVVAMANAMWHADSQGAAMAQAAQSACQAALDRLQPEADSDVLMSESFGPWQIEQVLGTGGMGVVYKVRRELDGIQQFAALKRIKRGMDSDAISARFLRERSLLSRLQHPNIAQFLDAGTLADGTPWLVMEYVDGVPLLAHIRATQASLQQRLALFIEICAAVSCAHRLLIVHRDIKPANVLVNVEGQVKLLDFGIAKVLYAPEEASAQTMTAQAPMTPVYAAPEQLFGGWVSTATDVHGLGLLLFEILCLQVARPNEAGANFRQWREHLAQYPPIAPSKCTNPAPGAIPAKFLRGDLDQITLKAMAHDPDRRYASVAALQEDIERFLQRKPIHARADSWGYQISRFVARHRLACALTGVFLIGLFSTSAFALWQAKRATQATERAVAVQRFMSSLFEIADPDTTPGGYKLSAREIVDAGALRFQSEFANEPELAAELSIILARVYSQLGDDKKALQLINDEKLAAVTSKPLQLQRWQQRVVSNIYLADADAAMLAATEVMRIAQAAGPEGTADAAQSLLWQSEIARMRDDFQGAVRLGDEAIRLARTYQSNDLDAHVSTRKKTILAEALVAKAGGLWQQKQPALAMPLLREAQAIYRTSGAAQSIGAIKVENNICLLQINLKEFTSGKPQCEHAVAVAEAFLPRLHNDVLMALGSRANFYRASGDYQAAINHMQTALRRSVEAKPADHPLVEFTTFALASIYLEAKQYDQALPQLEAALSLNRKREPKPTVLRARIQGKIAACLLGLGRLVEAKSLIELVLQLAQDLGDTKSKDYASYVATHARIVAALADR
jgi:eukaryotic-like serine/threonine-protein kinase